MCAPASNCVLLPACFCSVSHVISSRRQRDAKQWVLLCRRLLDVEGWAADIAMLRQQVAAADRKVTQLSLASRLPGAHRCCLANVSILSGACALPWLSVVGYCTAYM